ncbi:MAG: class III signal peptide-containing protein [Methanobrevibacter sp.]|nr:class III signal peptide-containing protein [Methanobrevibacter sp.]MBR0471140.1 class III signal peptide-containing protein [Methanosphaera sp.]
MFRKIDDKGQSSAEIILIIGGLLVIVLFVASYITNIINTTQNSFDGLIKQERDFLINKI